MKYRERPVAYIPLFKRIFLSLRRSPYTYYAVIVMSALHYPEIVSSISTGMFTKLNIFMHLEFVFLLIQAWFLFILSHASKAHEVDVDEKRIRKFFTITLFFNFILILIVDPLFLFWGGIHCFYLSYLIYIEKIDLSGFIYERFWAFFAITKTHGTFLFGSDPVAHEFSLEQMFGDLTVHQDFSWAASYFVTMVIITVSKELTLEDIKRKKRKERWEKWRRKRRRRHSRKKKKT